VTVPCLLEAWSAHEAEMLRYLRHHLRQPGEAEDLLHDLFLKAVRQRERFCAVGNPRAWLFAVARNLVIDHARAHARERALVRRSRRGGARPARARRVRRRSTCSRPACRAF
jgi:RNA polymerase sigma factor (sigma-70 family)